MGPLLGVVLSFLTFFLIYNNTLLNIPLQLEGNTAHLAQPKSSERHADFVKGILEKERVQVGDKIEDLKKRLALLQQEEKQKTLQEAKPSDPYVEELKKQRALARSETADATAQLALLETILSSDAKQSFPENLNSPLLQKMKEEYYALLRREAALTTSLGDRHPHLIEVRSEISNMTSQLQKELSDIASRSRYHKDIASSKERALEQAIDEAERGRDLFSSSLLQKNNLEVELETNQKRYLALLEYKQDLDRETEFTSPIQKQSPSQGTDIRILVLLLMILSFGLLGGFGLSSLGFLLWGKIYLQPAQRFIQIQESQKGNTNFRVQLPEISSYSIIPQSHFFSRKSDQLKKINTSLSTPKTPEDQTYRRRIFDIVKDICRSAQSRNTYITLVTSAKRGCGASSVALALARSAAMQEKRILLIDASSQKHALTEHFKIKPDPEWTVVLDRKEDLLRITSCDPETGLFFLPIALAEISTLRPSQIRRLNQGLKDLATSFDLVFLDVGCLLEDDAALNFVEIADEVLVVGSALTQKTRVEIDKILANKSKHYSLIENRVIGTEKLL